MIEFSIASLHPNCELFLLPLSRFFTFDKSDVYMRIADNNPTLPPLIYFLEEALFVFFDSSLKMRYGI